MSGGVDSLRTAILLREQGHEVFGIHMRFLPRDGDGPASEDENLLSELAARCEIPLFTVDLCRQFDSYVISPFVEAYLQGLTPNPCITCNPKMKFGLLLEAALERGAERLATGHYARLTAPVESASGRYQLRRAQDPSKDQSYFLMGLSQAQLARAVFPLGEYTKKETLAWAERTGMSTLIARDSQEICFIPSGSYSDFMRKRSGGEAGVSTGPILDMQGNYLGEHKGIQSYTVGQRRGLGVASTEPWYVVRIEPGENIVRVGRANDLFCETFTVTGVNWVSIACPDGPIYCEVRIRNQHRPARAEVTPIGAKDASIRLIEPQRAVTPGQAAVFYHDDLLLGGGIISRPA